MPSFVVHAFYFLACSVGLIIGVRFWKENLQKGKFLTIGIIALAVGSFFPDLDHFNNQCDFLTQTCLNHDRSLLFLHHFYLPFALTFVCLGWLLWARNEEKNPWLAYLFGLFTIGYLLHLFLDLVFYVGVTFL